MSCHKSTGTWILAPSSRRLSLLLAETITPPSTCRFMRLPHNSYFKLLIPTFPISSPPRPSIKITNMSMLPNIYYHARTPATSGSGDYTFSRLADATARQNHSLKFQKPQIRVNNATKDRNQSGSRAKHGYMVVTNKPPAVEWIDPEFIAESARVNRYTRIGHRPSKSNHQPRTTQAGISCCDTNKFQYPRKASSLGANRQSLVGRSTPLKFQHQDYCGNSAWAAQTHICYSGHTCHAPQCPDLIRCHQMCLSLYHDKSPQHTELPPSTQAQVQRTQNQLPSSENSWELDSNSDGGVPLDDCPNEDIAVVVDEIVRVIENLQAGYLADTEDGGNGYETHDGDDYSEDDGGGEESDDTIRAWRIHSCA